jgi:hypothetical protein
VGFALIENETGAGLRSAPMKLPASGVAVFLDVLEAIAARPQRHHHSGKCRADDRRGRRRP